MSTSSAADRYRHLVARKSAMALSGHRRETPAWRFADCCSVEPAHRPSLSLVPRWPAVSAEGKTECNQTHSGFGQPSRESRDMDSNTASDKKMSL